MAEIGVPVPALDHAVSVSLPSWDSTVAYEEGAEWVVSKMKTGYPRFFINSEIRALADSIVDRHGSQGQAAMLFPSSYSAEKCLDFIERKLGDTVDPNVADPKVTAKDKQILELRVRELGSEVTSGSSSVFAVMYPEALSSIAAKFWQHTGEGISSRRARFLQQSLDSGRLEPHAASGRNSGVGKMSGMDRSTPPEIPSKQLAAEQAKAVIRARVAGNPDAYKAPEAAINGHRAILKGVRRVPEEDVFLYPTGMSAIFNIHQLLIKVKGPAPSIMFGFPYTDTLKILENFGPGCTFFEQCSESELDELQARCEKGERYLALFCEVPGNPLLKTPNLRRIKELANRFGFAVVVDDTIGNFLNIDVLPSVDAIVSSLTKVFSGASNVMGGSLVLNPHGQYHDLLRQTLQVEYHDHYWPEDAIVMEQNSRDFVDRNQLINENAQRLCESLRASPIIKDIFYPELSSTRSMYDTYRTTNGGYGGLFSLTFHSSSDARCFFDALGVTKGPSLGTNFTIASPYVILAHFHELDWAESCGVPADLVRVSVGVEKYEDVLATFQAALRAVEARGRD